MSIPAPTDSFAIRVGAPTGANRLYAIVVPPGVSIDDITGRGIDMRAVLDAPSLWRDLNGRIRSAGPGAPKVEAVGVYAYEIVP